MCVVDDLLAHVDRRPALRERPLDDLDRARDAGAGGARGCEHDVAVARAPRPSPRAASSPRAARGTRGGRRWRPAPDGGSRSGACRARRAASSAVARARRRPATPTPCRPPARPRGPARAGARRTPVRVLETIGPTWTRRPPRRRTPARIGGIRARQRLDLACAARSRARHRPARAAGSSAAADAGDQRRARLGVVGEPRGGPSAARPHADLLDRLHGAPARIARASSAQSARARAGRRPGRRRRSWWRSSASSQAARQRHDREHDAIEVVVDVEVAGEAGARVLRARPSRRRRAASRPGSGCRGAPRASARRPRRGRAAPTPSAMRCWGRGRSHARSTYERGSSPHPPSGFWWASSQRDRAADALVVARHAGGDQRRHYGAGAVDVVDAPTSEPRALGLLLVAEPRERRGARRRCRRVPARRASPARGR